MVAATNTKESWVNKLVVATERNHAQEKDLSRADGKVAASTNQHGYYYPKSSNIPPGTIVLVVKDTGNKISFFYQENTWEADKITYEICLPSTVLEGKSFCFTGALSRPRDYFETLVSLHGGEFKKTVSADLAYLVMSYKNSFSRKAQLAKSKGIECLDEDQLQKLINDGLAAVKAQQTPTT